MSEEPSDYNANPSERDTCFRCDWLYITHASGPYSDETPGEDFTIGCSKEHFWISGSRYEHDKETWAEAIVRSRTCKDFEKRAGKVAR